MNHKILFNLILILLLFKCINCANILMITMCGTKSHTVPFISLSNKLVERGHNITFLNGFPGAAEMGNAEEISPPKMVEYIYDFHKDIDFIGTKFHGTYAITPTELFRYGHELCDTLLNDEQFQIFLNQDRHFDLIIIDSTFSSCALGLAYKYKAPYIFLNAVAYYTLPLSFAGNIISYSTSPYMFSGFTNDMNLMQRGWNAICFLIEWLGNYIHTQYYIQPMLEKKFGHDIPQIIDMQKNVSFILNNAHPLLTYQKSLLPNVAEIGCIHCRSPNKLPQDLEEWVKGSGSNGVILVSMGSFAKESSMPSDLRKIFLTALSKIPHRVIWKWTSNETNNFPEAIPSNIKIVDWMPQQDLLGHPNVIAMISHGGLLSMFETAYHGKPSVMLPVFFDHDTNAAAAQQHGYALKLELQGLTTQALIDAVTKITTDPSYKINANIKANLLRDLPMTPLETSVFWVEHVIRHNGANHLKAKTVNILSYCYIDVILSSIIFIYCIYKFNDFIDKITHATDKLFNR